MKPLYRKNIINKKEKMTKKDKLTLKIKGAEWFLYANSTKVGKANVNSLSDRRAEKYFYLPPKTGSCGAIDIFDKYKRRGYGKKFVKLIEKEAKKKGMKNFAFTNVDNVRFFRSVGYYALPGMMRIMVKSLITGRIPARVGYTRGGWVRSKEKEGKYTRKIRRLKGTKSKVIRGARENYVERLISETQVKRTSRARKIDNKKIARNAFVSSALIPVKQAKIWAKHPNRYDIWGVDTPI